MQLICWFYLSHTVQYHSAHTIVAMEMISNYAFYIFQNIIVH